MYTIKIIVIIIAVNVVKAERGTSKHHLKTIHDENIKRTDLEEKNAYTGRHHMPSPMNVYQLFEEKSASSETSLGTSDDYESLEYEETVKGNTRRFIENQDDTQSGEEDRNASQEDKTVDVGSVEDRTTKESNNKRDNDEFETDSAKRKMQSHRIILDTKGRSAVEDSNAEDFKLVPANVRTLGDRRLGNPSRNGYYVTPYYATMPRTGLFQGPLYTVHHPLMFQTNLDLSTSTRSPIIEEKGNLPLFDSNSYPYQPPLTKINEPQNDDDKLDILKKLIEATNSALISDSPVPHLEPINMYGNFNPGTRRFY